MTGLELDDFLVERSVDPCRRASSPGDARERGPRWLAFEADVRRALARLKAEALEANAVLPQGTKPKAFSVNAVMRASGRGRTQLYTEHKDLVAEIEQARKDVDAATAGVRMAGRGDSVPVLRRRLAVAEERHRKELAVMASTQLSDLVEKLGPIIRDRTIRNR
jgi:hypothetical protein